jgi:hypothetical protein
MLLYAFPEDVIKPIPVNYRNAHYNHPASIWTRSSRSNIEWLILHGISQCEEYTRRYKRRHDSQNTIEWVEQNYKYINFPIEELTNYARCFGPYTSVLNNDNIDSLTAYRKFYWLDKRNFARWPSKKYIPEWWPDISDSYVDKNFINGIYSKR